MHSQFFQDVTWNVSLNIFFLFVFLFNIYIIYYIYFVLKWKRKVLLLWFHLFGCTCSKETRWNKTKQKKKKAEVTTNPYFLLDGLCDAQHCAAKPLSPRVAQMIRLLFDAETHLRVTIAVSEISSVVLESLWAAGAPHCDKQVYFHLCGGVWFPPRRAHLSPWV